MPPSIARDLLLRSAGKHLTRPARELSDHLRRDAGLVDDAPVSLPPPHHGRHIALRLLLGGMADRKHLACEF